MLDKIIVSSIIQVVIYIIYHDYRPIMVWTAIRPLTVLNMDLLLEGCEKMVLTYKECIERFGSDYMIKKEISAGNLFQKEKGLYSDRILCTELEIIAAKYPKAVFAGESAYYYYGFTDVIPDYYCLATRRGDTRIKDKSIKQIYVNDKLYDYGKCTMEYQSTNISIYSKERLLVDLIRFKSKYPFDYYKEIIGNYRRTVEDLDFFSMEDYAGMLKHGKKIMDAIQLEVM